MKIYNQQEFNIYSLQLIVRILKQIPNYEKINSLFIEIDIRQYPKIKGYIYLLLFIKYF